MPKYNLEQKASRLEKRNDELVEEIDEVKRIFYKERDQDKIDLEKKDQTINLLVREILRKDELIKLLCKELNFKLEEIIVNGSK